MDICFSHPPQVTCIAFRRKLTFLASFCDDRKYHCVFLACPTGLATAHLGAEHYSQHTMESSTREIEDSLCYGNPQRKWILQERNNISMAEIKSVFEFQIEAFPHI